jgi:hypothetical protein
MQYIAIYHANLNYAFLIPENYERVIRASYEVIIDGHARYPDAKYVFEASGYTIDQMAKLTPDVLAKLRAAIDRGQCEFMGAPYSHPIMANIPEEDGYWSCEFAMRSYEQHLGFRPESFWNPECTWMQHVPRAFARAGVKYLTLDFESYMNCNDKDYSWVERNRAHDMSWGGHLPWYPLDPDHPALHLPFRDIVPGLHGLCRSDRLIGKYLGYFRGDKVTLDDLIDNLVYWSGTKKQGSTIFIADDAEYCGTTGYYYVKYYGDYSRSFDIDPTAAERLDALIRRVLKVGPMATFKEGCEGVSPINEAFFVEDRFAWHRTYADAWANTPEARRWEPVLEAMRHEYRDKFQPIVEAPDKRAQFKDLIERFWFHMSNSANSDGRWPPPPNVTCPFNRDWVEQEIAATQAVLNELKAKTAGLSIPADHKPSFYNEADSDYGFHFTDKDPRAVRKLSTYELTHAIYHFHKMVDSGIPDKVRDGKSMLVAVFDEFDRRGMQGIRPNAIQ